MRRRALVLALLAAPAARAEGIRRGRPIVFPRDHGAHLESRTEWWYATGWIGPFAAPTHGFQVTFFRSRTDLAGDNPSRFAPRQLLFAHAALTDLRARSHRHAARIVRWDGRPGSALAGAAEADGDVHIGRWRLHHAGDTWHTTIDDAQVPLRLALRRTQPPLLQGDAGFSRKGPEERQASHYVGEPQLAVSGPLGEGRGWMDHEWSDEILAAEAVGWDWIGFNLDDGAALTAFRLRRADGTALWAGGSFRPAGGAVRNFGPDEVLMTPGRTWTSGGSGARYPVEWTVQTPAGRFAVRTLLDAQEVDGRGSTGTVYWEGLSELLDAQGRRVGLGYLELTGYASRLRM
ncbi:MAG: lipocalin-like domain-containing protein [Rubrivivax sp.]